MKKLWAAVLLALCSLPSLRSLAATPLPGTYAVSPKLADKAEIMMPSEVKLNGYLGRRVLNSEKNRLLEVDEDALLAGFRHRPGEQAWIGEHVGKWLHAATLAWQNTGDPKLKTKLDRMVRELLKTQEPDGYLGTYVKGKRFGLYENADWDVWVHKYDLIGLLTYYRYTRDQKALTGARKVGDLLLATFGPGKKSIISAGTHMGMAATSVLEPMVLLYRTTGDSRYLDFARYIVRAWDEPNGPKIAQTLITKKKVNETANGKAYEMLSNLVGLCELARATGDRTYLQPALNAWKDIVQHQLYVTGGASYGEHFHADDDLPNSPGANVGETCVTVTWIQLNSQLLRLTGEARFANEMEQSYYNHLAGAQRPDGAEWCYYTALQGTKPYGPGINCCVSSGPRGMAMAPQHAYLRYQEGGKDGIAVNLFDSSEVTTRLGGQTVTLKLNSGFPHTPTATLTIHTKHPATLGLRVRSPEWARPLRVGLSGSQSSHSIASGGWTSVPARQWKDGDQVLLHYHLAPRLVVGEGSNRGREAVFWGPFAMAYDEKANPGLPNIGAVVLGDENGKVALTPASGNPVALKTSLRSARGSVAQSAVLVPFSEAGSGGGRYQVWLRDSQTTADPNGSLFAYSQEDRSREGNAQGEISDGDAGTYVVTFDGRRGEED